MKNGGIEYTGDIESSVAHYLNAYASKSDNDIISNIKWTKSTLHINNIEINGTSDSYSVIGSDQKTLEVLIEGYTDEKMTYDIMLILKSKEGIPMAMFSKGHYMGEIYHLEPGDFSLKRRIVLPEILSKGQIQVDLNIHHPMVEYYMKAPNCCTLEAQGYQHGFGRTMNQDSCGLIGLLDL